MSHQSNFNVSLFTGTFKPSSAYAVTRKSARVFPKMDTQIGSFKRLGQEPG